MNKSEWPHDRDVDYPAPMNSWIVIAVAMLFAGVLILNFTKQDETKEIINPAIKYRVNETQDTITVFVIPRK